MAIVTCTHFSTNFILDIISHLFLINNLCSFTDKWEIDASEITLLEELGSGQFGVSINYKTCLINKIFHLLLS